MSDDKRSRLCDDAVLHGPSELGRAFAVPVRSPVTPVKPLLDDTIRFDCHKGIA